MNDLTSVKTALNSLTGDLKANAEALLARMEEVVEGIGDEPIRWKAPTLRLVQGTTDRTTLPRGATIGDFVLGEVKLEKPLSVIVLMIHDGRQYWSPDQTENKMLCSSPDAKLGYIGNNCRDCQHSTWVEGEGSDCGKIKQALCITSDLTEVFWVNFAKTNYQVGMELTNLMKKAMVSPYKRVYELSSQTNAKNKNVENLAVRPAAVKATSAEALPFVEALFKVAQAERVESVKKFYEFVQTRTDKNSAPKLGNDTADTVLLTSDTSASESAVDTELVSKYVL